MNHYYLQTPTGECVYFLEDSDRAWQFNLPATAKTVYQNGKAVHSWMVVTDGPATSIPVHFTEVEWGDTYTYDGDLKLTTPITAAEHAQLPEGVQDLYRRSRTQRVMHTALDVSQHRPLNGAMPKDPPPSNWQPNAMALVYGPHLEHLVSGYLVGFADHALAICKEYGEAYADTSSQKATIKVNIRVWWDPPKYGTFKNGRRREARQTWNTIQVKVVVPLNIGGATLADAEINWKTHEDELRAQLELERQTKACSHCDGLGYVTLKADQ